jgi:hypothetical protein
VCYAGSILLILSAPVLTIAFLAIAYLIISGEDQIPEYVISRNFPYFFFLTQETFLTYALNLLNLFCIHCQCKKLYMPPIISHYYVILLY